MSRRFPGDISPFPRRWKGQFNRIKFSEVFPDLASFISVFPDVLYQKDRAGKIATDSDGNQIIEAGSMKYIADDYWVQLSIYLEDFYLNVKHEFYLDPTDNFVKDKGIKKGRAMAYIALQKYQIQWQRLRDLASTSNDKFFGNDTTTTTHTKTSTNNTDNNDSYVYNQSKLDKPDANGNTVKVDKFKDDGSLSHNESSGQNDGSVKVENTKYNVDQLEELLDASEDPDAWVIDRLIHFIAAPFQPDEKDLDIYE